MKFSLNNFFVLVLFISVSFLGKAQLPEKDEMIKAALKKHILFLADDKLEGRLVGSKGEKAACLYIEKEFKKE